MSSKWCEATPLPDVDLVVCSRIKDSFGASNINVWTLLVLVRALARQAALSGLSVGLAVPVVSVKEMLPGEKPLVADMFLDGIARAIEPARLLPSASFSSGHPLCEPDSVELKLEKARGGKQAPKGRDDDTDTILTMRLHASEMPAADLTAAMQHEHHQLQRAAEAVSLRPNAASFEHAFGVAANATRFWRRSLRRACPLRLQVGTPAADGPNPSTYADGVMCAGTVYGGEGVDEFLSPTGPTPTGGGGGGGGGSGGGSGGGGGGEAQEVPRRVLARARRCGYLFLRENPTTAQKVELRMTLPRETTRLWPAAMREAQPGIHCNMCGRRLVPLQSVGAVVAAELSLRRLDCALVNALPPADSTQLTDANVQAFGLRPRAPLAPLTASAPARPTPSSSRDPHPGLLQGGRIAGVLRALTAGARQRGYHNVTFEAAKFDVAPLPGEGAGHAAARANRLQMWLAATQTPLLLTERGTHWSDTLVMWRKAQTPPLPVGALHVARDGPLKCEVVSGPGAAPRCREKSSRMYRSGCVPRGDVPCPWLGTGVHRRTHQQCRC